MQQKSLVVVVIGIGAGKSMLFMLLASCLTGVMVMVVLLVSLQGNLKDYYKQAGIKCVKWDSRRPSKWALIVLVTLESVVSESFSNFIS